MALIGRIYFIALIPFLGAAVGPWVLGHENIHELPVFMLWSFTALVFAAAAYWGALVHAQTRLINVHLLFCLSVVALGLIAVLMSGYQTVPFASVALLGGLHWLNLKWMQKTGLWQSLAKDFTKQHQKFVWVALACHMFVLLNLIYSARLS